MNLILTMMIMMMMKGRLWIPGLEVLV